MKSLLVTAVGALVSILLLVFLDDWQQTLRASAQCANGSGMGR